MEPIYLDSPQPLTNAREALIYGFGDDNQRNFKTTYKDSECSILQERACARSFQELKIIAETYEGREVSDEELMRHIHYINKNIKKLSMWYCGNADKVVVFDRNKWLGAGLIGSSVTISSSSSLCGYNAVELQYLYNQIAQEDKELSSIL